MDIVVIGRIQISPEYILFVEHEPEKLNKEYLFDSGELIDCRVYFIRRI
jgi:hypothetical protein